MWVDSKRGSVGAADPDASNFNRGQATPAFGCLVVVSNEIWVAPCLQNNVSGLWPAMLGGIWAEHIYLVYKIIRIPTLYTVYTCAVSYISSYVL